MQEMIMSPFKIDKYKPRWAEQQKPSIWRSTVQAGVSADQE